jgi:hypothetical protein
MQDIFKEEPQIIEGKGVDPRKLVNLCKEVYGTTDDGGSKFRVEVSYPALSASITSTDNR